MPLALFAGFRPATAPLTRTPNRHLHSHIDLHPVVMSKIAKPRCTYPATPSNIPPNRAASTKMPHPPRSNPHSSSPRHRHTFPPSRFPPLEAFGRRPPEYVQPPSAAGIRNPSQQRLIKHTADTSARPLKAAVSMREKREAFDKLAELIGRIVSPPADKVVALRHHNDVDIDQ
jgi:hypothetical protein